jgi:hypothetical protein
MKREIKILDQLNNYREQEKENINYLKDILYTNRSSKKILRT